MWPVPRVSVWNISCVSCSYERFSIMHRFYWPRTWLFVYHFLVLFAGCYPLVNVNRKLWKITMLSMGKSTISMVIFNSYVTNYQRVHVSEVFVLVGFVPVTSLCLTVFFGTFLTPESPIEKMGTSNRFPVSIFPKKTSHFSSCASKPNLLPWPLFFLNRLPTEALRHKFARLFEMSSLPGPSQRTGAGWVGPRWPAGWAGYGWMMEWFHGNLW